MEIAYAKTCFYGLYSDIQYGELDGTQEMMQTYYDYFLDHRVTIHSVPTNFKLVHSYDIRQAEDYLDKVEEAHNNPKATLYEIPTSNMRTPANSGIMDTEYVTCHRRTHQSHRGLYHRHRMEEFHRSLTL